MELKILGTYIMINLAKSFIRPLKFFAETFILFIQKLDKNLRLCMDYQGLNNLIVKNQYILPLIGELIDCLN